MSTEQCVNWNEIDEIVKKLQGIAALLRYRWGTCYVPGILRGVLRVLRVHDPWILRWFSSSSAFKKRPMGTRYSISQCAGTQNAQSWFRAKWKQKVTSKTHESFWEILRVFVIYVKKMYHLQFIWSKAGNGTDKSRVAAWFPHFLDFQRVWKR